LYAHKNVAQLGMHTD